MNNIAKKAIIFSLVGIMQLGLCTSAFASPYDNHQANQMHHERLEREKQQQHERERRDRIERENRRHQEEMRRHHGEDEHAWHARQEHERERHDRALRAI